MKKLLLGLIIIFPLQAISADDSVYTWGAWSQGIQPAAGPAVAAVPTPSPIKTPNINFRPNENSAFFRTSTTVVTLPPQAQGPSITVTLPEVVLPNPTSRFR